MGCTADLTKVANHYLDLLFLCHGYRLILPETTAIVHQNITTGISLGSFCVYGTIGG